MPSILLTGGAGYIGSHTAIELLTTTEYDVVIVDNFCHAELAALDRIAAIAGRSAISHHVDASDATALEAVFAQTPDIVGVIHFAARIFVPESVANPTLYYRNNLLSLINVLDCSAKYGVKGVIFSSSCSVYGNIAQLPVTEQTPVARAESPYAYTKVAGERILEDFARASGVKGISLRYFNPAGAHPTGLNGEPHRKAHGHLVPVIVEAASGARPPLTVFGSDYPTRDGSCVRDYVHVCDIASGHIAALRYLLDQQNAPVYDVFNLGSGTGMSVLEAIGAFEKASGVKVPYSIGPRREGDVAAVYSDCTKAREILGWTPRYGADEIMASAWKWQQYLNDH